MAKVTYWGHSGFSVRTGAHLLVFDYLGGGMAAPTPADHAIAFVSHAHHDHFTRIPVQWHDEGRGQLVVGYDLPQSVGGIRMKPGDSAQVDEAQVQAFGSTDQGVSFLVQSGGLSVFHAGDFNFWHWRAESTIREVAEAERDFCRILNEIRGHAVDLAFFPVDPRLGRGHDEGAMRFAEAIRPAVIIPMHWWDEAQVADAFVQKAMPDGVRAAAITKRGETIEV